MTVYLLHFTRRYAHAGHYLGVTTNLERRVHQHRKGGGSRLMAVVSQAGIDFTVARLWEGDRTKERQLKRQGGASRLCPVCKAQKHDTAR